MKYELEHYDLHKYLYKLKEKTYFKDFISEMESCMETCNIIAEYTGDLYKMEFGELKNDIHKVKLETEIKSIWLEEKPKDSGGYEYWYTIRFADPEMKLTDEEIIKIGLDFIKVKNQFLKLLKKKIAPESLYEITEIGGLECDAKGPYFTYNYNVCTKKGNTLDKGMGVCYFENYEKKKK